MYILQIKSIPRAMGLNSDKLITGGIFSISRNPQSVARGIGLIGIGIMGRSFFTLYLALIWILINHITILVEEKYLEEIFGELYIKYMALTPRYYKVNNKKKLS
jgi:protein-S-isoprenylcysteine O-methyltransferase Ste14